MCKVSCRKFLYTNPNYLLGKTTPVARVYTYFIAPPTTNQLLSTIETYGLPAKIYRDPFYSKASDVPRRPREHAGRIFRLTGGSGLKSLDDWDSSSVESIISEGKHQPLPTLGIGGWEYSIIPPSLRECRGWLDMHPATQEAKSTLQRPARSQVNSIVYHGPTPTVNSCFFVRSSVPLKLPRMSNPTPSRRRRRRGSSRT